MTWGRRLNSKTLVVTFSIIGRTGWGLGVPAGVRPVAFVIAFASGLARRSSQALHGVKVFWSWYGRVRLLLPTFIKFPFSKAARRHLIQKSQHSHSHTDLFSNANSPNVFGFPPVTLRTTSFSLSSEPPFIEISMDARTWAYSLFSPAFLTWRSASSSTVRLT